MIVLGNLDFDFQSICDRKFDAQSRDDSVTDLRRALAISSAHLFE